MTMSTQFRQPKFAKVFDLYDVNKDGYIDAADYARVGEGLGTATGSAPGSAGYEKMRSDYLEYWDQLRLGADTDHDGRVSQAEFVAHYETLPAIKETILAVVQGILGLTDWDGDGKISQAEFAADLQAHNVEAPAAAEAFSHLDRNGDGFIDTDELVLNVEEFLFGDDEQAPGSWLFGPL
jgi:Ca2+-binding EF-hand superfamily protein